MDSLLNTTPKALNESMVDSTALMDQLRRAGLLDAPELEQVTDKRQSGVGSLPQPMDFLSPMVRSVQQVDR